MVRCRQILQLMLVASLLESCHEPNQDFHSYFYTSKKNERVYFNSVNWGVTADHQLSAITKDSNKLKYDFDTSGTALDIEPFVYSINNDTITLYFNRTIKYRVKDSFQSITIVYKVVDNPEFMGLVSLAMINDKFHGIPRK